MDYSALAVELLEKMQALHKTGPHRHIIERLQGGAFVLHYISRRGEDVLPGEISQEMGVSSARIAAALNSLEGKGLLNRRIDSNDRRKILVSLTEEGKACADDLYNAVLKTAVKLLEMLGERDAGEYVRLTGRIAENINNIWEAEDRCFN
jgi:DNA-binding MarR family transcriptional regulator